MSLRREAREIAIQTLYAISPDMELQEDEIDDISRLVEKKLHQTLEFKNKKIKDSQITFIYFLVKNTLIHLNEIDLLIQRFSKNWEFSRISLIDKCILRIATMEIKFSETPGSVVINEAVEIAKDFCGLKSSKFINGILDAILNRGKQI